MTEENSKQEGLGPRWFEFDRKVLTEADAAADLAGVPRPVPIDYMVLQEFAATHRAPYNELCTAVRQAIGYQPRDSNKQTVQRQPSLEERMTALEQRVVDLQRWQLSMVGKAADRDMAAALSATPDGRLR